MLQRKRTGYFVNAKPGDAVVQSLPKEVTLNLQSGE